MKTNLVIAALLLVAANCPAPVSPKAAGEMQNTRMLSPLMELAQKAIARSKTGKFAAVIPPAPSVPRLAWEKSVGATGYVLRGNDFANVNLTNVIVLGDVATCPDPGWLYMELTAVNGNAAQDSVPLPANRLRQGATEVSFIPLPGKTTQLEGSDDLKTWALVRTKVGSSLVSVTVPTKPVKFYRLNTP